jgi:hypothetical protein
VFTRASQWPLSSAKRIQSTSSHLIPLRPILILYRDGGTCWDYRLSHSIFHTLYCQLHRRSYNRSVTNSSLTNCVDCSPFPSTLLTVDYFRWRPTIHRRLSVLVASSLANYWLLSSPAGPPTLLLSRLTLCRLSSPALQTNWLFTPKVGKGERYSRHLWQLFIYAL